MSTPAPAPIYGAYQERKLADYILRLRVQLDTNARLERVYITRYGNLVAVVVDDTRQWRLRWAQDHWRKAD